MSETTPPASPEPTPYAAAPAAGAPYAGAPAGAPAQPKVLSIISMVAGILGIISFGYFGIASIAAVILGFMGKKREPAAKGFWLTGIITGFVGIAIMIVMIFLWIGIFVAAANLEGGSYSY